MDPEDNQYSRALYIASLLYKEMEKEWLTDKEREDLDAWIKEKESHAGMYSALQDRDMLADGVAALSKYDTQTAKKEVFAQLGIRSAQKVRRMRVIRNRMIAAAAAVVLLLGGVGLFTLKERQPVYSSKNDVAPGGNRATLTLGDGSTIVLDSSHNGRLARQQAAIVSGQNGQVVYNAISGAKGVEYNTMTTPRGGQFSVVLPDGSRVLLNAASSLKYPTTFTGNERTVELSGEAYFDVAKNKSQPFVVKTSHLDIKVLGTNFDIMAYGDEPRQRTTLVSGSVQVSMGSQIQILAPGQQALVDEAGTGFAIIDADVDKDIAWTTGFFKFGHTDIRTIMREISRWYDIDVVYEAKMNDSDTYSGRISRNLPLSDLITFLEGNGIHHFRIEGRRLTVLP